MRGSALTGLAATLVAGGASLVSSLAGSWQPAAPVAVAWWAAYLAYVVVFVLHAELVVARTVLAERPAVLALLLLGLVVWFLEPNLTWMATLFVVTAASCSSVFSRRAAVALVVLQSAAVAVGMVLTSADLGTALALVGAFASFQAFAAAVTTIAEREIAARAEADRATRRLGVVYEDLRSAHVELRAATVLLAAASRDAERLRIARELHDGVGHQLTALALELEIAAHHRDDRHVTRARNLAKDLLGEVRLTVSALREEPQRLATSLRELLGELPGVTVTLDVDLPEPPSQEAALAVVRAVQEIATNTLRHASASRLEVHVGEDEDGALTVRAHDDGRGAHVVVPGNGLRGMGERVRALGGRVTFASAPGEGFGVQIRVPREGARGSGRGPVERGSGPGSAGDAPEPPDQGGKPAARAERGGASASASRADSASAPDQGGVSAAPAERPR